MLQYSFSTVLMAILSSTIVIIFTAVCFRYENLLVSFGYKMFAVVLGITFLRFALPFQFPFAANIVMSEGLSRIIAIFRRPFLAVGPFNVSMWGMFEAVWLIGILVRLALFIRDCLAFNHWVVWQSISLTDNGHYSRLLDEACGGGPNPFSVYELRGLKVPMLYGIRNPRILVPEGMELQEEEMRYLLSHETAHHFHHDIIVKLGLSLLSIIYWWNPACRILQEQLDAVLEMRIDDYVMDGTFDSRRGYMRCIIQVAEDRAGQGQEQVIRVPENSIMLFNPKHYNTLTNRLNVIAREPKPYAKLLHVSALVLTAGVYLFSYAFIFEARYSTPEEDMVVFELLDPYTYIVMTEDNAYEVYYGDLLVERVDSLENYPEETPVYDSLDDVPAEIRVTMY